MFEKLANIFRIPDLRQRILFTLGLLAVYRLGGHIPTPGVNADKLQQYFEQNRGSFLGFVDLFSGGQLRRLTIFASGNYAVHYGLHHFAVAYRGLRATRQTAKRRRARPQKNHPMDPLPHRHPERGPISRHRYQPRKRAATSW